MQFERSTIRTTSKEIPALHLAAVYAAQAKLLIEREIPETRDLLEFRKLHDLTEVLQHVVIVLEQLQLSSTKEDLQ
jgi:hypothetical protein